MDPKLTERLNNVVRELDRIEAERLARDGMLPEIIAKIYRVTWKERSKYVAIDFGTSGAFLVDKATGELYNIKAYGVPDVKKKRRANIGNLYSVDPRHLHANRWLRLR